MKYTRFIYAFFALLFCILIFSARNACVCLVARCCLGYSSWSIVCSDLEFGRTIRMQHVTLETNDHNVAIHIPECTLHWFSRTPQLHVQEPTVIICGETDENIRWVERILNSAIPSLPLCIERANCKWIKKDSSANFTLSYDFTQPQIPYASLTIQEEETQGSQMAFRLYYCREELLIDSEFKHLDLNWLDSIVRVLPNCHCQEGRIDGQCWLALNKSHEITKCMGQLHLEKLQLLQEQEHLELSCADSTMYFTYPAIGAQVDPQFWYKDLVLQGDLNGGRVLMKHSVGEFPIAITDIQGKIEMNSVKQSKVLLEGMFDYQGKISPFCLAANPSEFERGGVLDFDVMLLLDPNLCTSTNLALSVVAEDNGGWHVKGKMQDLGIAQLSVFQHVLGLGAPSIKELHLVDGSASCEMSMYFAQGTLHKLALDHLVAQDLEIAWPKKGIRGSCCNLKARAQIDTLSPKEQKAPCWELMMDQGLVCIGPPDAQKVFTDVGIELFVANHLFEHSSVHCTHKGMQTEIAFNGSRQELAIDGKMHGQVSDVLSWLSKRSGEFAAFDQDLLEVCVQAHLGIQETHCTGKAFIESSDGTDCVNFSCDLDRNLLQATPEITLANVNHGSFSTDEISCRIFEMVQAYLASDIGITGRVALEGTFNRNAIDCQIATPMFSFASPLFQLDMPHRFSHISKGYFHYDVQSQYISASLPVEQAFCRELDTHLEFQDIEALFVVDGPWVHVKNMQTESSGLIIEGQMSYQYAHEPRELRLQVDRLLGTVSQCNHLISTLPSFGKFTIPMDGTLIGGPGTLHLTTVFREGVPESIYDLQIHLQHGAMEVTPDLRLGDLAFDISYQSEKEQLVVSQVQGGLISPYLNDKMYLRGKEITYKAGQIAFDVGIENALLDLVYCKGSYDCETGACALDKNRTHFLDQKLTSFVGHFDISQGLQDCAMIFSWDTENFVRALSYISPEFIPRFLPKLSEHQEILCQLTLQMGLWDLQLAGQNLDLQITEQEKDHYTIHSCNWGDFMLGGEVYRNGGQITIEQLRASYENGHYTCNEGIYDITTQAGHLPISYYIETITPEAIPIVLQGEGVLQTQKSAKGSRFPDVTAKMGFDAQIFTPDVIRARATTPFGIVLCSNNALEIVDADLQIQEKEEFQVHIDLAKIDMSQKQCTHISGTTDGAQAVLTYLIDQEILKDTCRGISIATKPETAFAIDWQPVGYVTSVNIPQLQYVYEDKEIEITQTLCTWGAQKDLVITAQTSLYDTPFSIQAQLGPSELLPLRLQAYHNENLALSLDMDLANSTIHKLAGDIFGLQFAFYPEFTANLSPYQTLQGDISIEADKLSPVTCPDVADMIRELGLRKGVSLQGTLQIPYENPLEDTQFQGWLRGSDFDLLGYQFRTLSGAITINPNEVHISDISISDEAVQGNIPEWTTTYQEGDWHLQIPHVQLLNLRPSILRKPEPIMQSVKPFIIKELNIQDITGVLSDPDTLLGKGHLVFTNTFKEGHQLLDIPIEIISRLGLDMVLLVPIYGELEYVLKDGKVSFTKLKNSYSENKRSYFYLANHKGESYLDLKGNLHMDIKMKQYVLFKITEFFILSLDGPLDNPSVFLRT